MTLPVRVACVGAGYFSQFHLGSWTRMNDVSLVGVADHNLKAAEATGLTAYSETGDMLREARPDVLDIILPPSGQAATIEQALSSGIRTIICQKPFCTSLAEAEAMVEKAERSGVTLIVHENFRFMPWYRFINSALEAGAVGRLLNVTFRLRPGDGQGPDAYLARQPYFQHMPRFLVHETAVHWIDVFSYLLGAPQAVYADLRRLNPAIAGEDAGTIIFNHPDDVSAIFDGNRLLDHASDNARRTMGEALFEGTEATLSLFGDGRVERRAFGSVESQIVLAPDRWDGFGGDCVHAFQSHVLAFIQDGAPLETEARIYLSVLRTRDAIYRSADEGVRVALV